MAGLSDAGLTKLAESVAVSSTLVKLSLYGNRFGLAGVSALAKAVAQSTSLRELNVGGNEAVGDAGAEELAQAVAVSTSLEVLKVGRCAIRDAGAVCLARAVVANPARTFKSLDLMSFSVITDAGAFELAKMVESAASLECVQVYGSLEVSAAGAEAVLRAISRSARLHDFDGKTKNDSDGIMPQSG